MNNVFCHNNSGKCFHRVCKTRTSLQTKTENNFFSVLIELKSKKKVFKIKTTEISISSGDFSIFMPMPVDKCKFGVFKGISVHMLYYY